MASYVTHPMIKPETVESRSYQEVLAARVLDKGSTLVVAPTALGKTIIAILLSAHILEKNSKAKVLFLAPTKPLAAQHEKSFKKFLKVEEKAVSLITGAVPPNERKAIWEASQLIAATPQTIRNDLAMGRIDLDGTELVIFDEAHRAVKDYAYVYIAQKYVKRHKRPLILALTASPGSEEQQIQDVCRNLFVKNIEIKREQDEDVKQYTKEIEVECQKIELPKEFIEIKILLEQFMRAQLLFLKKLGYARSINATYFGKKQMLEVQSMIRRDLVLRAKNQPSIYLAASRVASLLKVSHAHTLLETQGIGALQDYFERMKLKSNDSKAPKALKFLLGQESITSAITLTEKLYKNGVSHPKLERLKKILQTQFSEFPESRVLVFNHYRDSIKNLEIFLSSMPLINAKRFIGQATKEGDKGLSQKEQIKIVSDFREGKYNTLLCSSVGEEGLDIPAVDLVVFFEAVPSEIRSIQRRGRTGRFAKGKVILLMAKGTRDESYYWASAAKERRMHSTLSKMQSAASLGSAQGASKELPKQSTLVKFVDEVKDKVLIYADTREMPSKVVTALSDMGALVKVKQLEVGDYVLSDQIVVERKTVEDFLNSMLDGRLFSQLAAMASNYTAPLMLVEGRLDELYSLRNIHKNAIIGALTSIALNYRVPVLFTRDVSETAEFIFVTAKREQLGKEKDIRLRIGRKGMSLKEQQQFVVESLPLVGPGMAKNLLKKFGSVKNIVNAKSPELQGIENLGPKKAKQMRKVIISKYKDD